MYSANGGAANYDGGQPVHGHGHGTAFRRCSEPSGVFVRRADL